MNWRRWLPVAIVPFVLFTLNLGETSANPPTERPLAVSSEELAHDLSMLAVGRPASAEELDRLAAQGYGPEALSDFIRALVQKPEFASIVSDVLRLRGSSVRQTGPMTALQATSVDGRQVYYTKRPCESDDVEPVRPWWDLDETVLVCRDAYRPDVFQTEDGHYCSGLWASTAADTPCGCGPNLMRCYRGNEDTQGIAQGLAHEMSSTVRHVVGEDMPLQRLFDSQESYRDGWSELVYLRSKVENGDGTSLDDSSDWRDWPEEGRWAPRPESENGQHAGIFTNHYFLNSVDSQRLKASLLFETLWCTEGQLSSGVETETVLNASAARASDEDWQHLAALPGCTECHARIEHAVQFAQGISYWVVASHYVARRTPDVTERLFGRNMDDPRGQGPRNPAGLVRLVLDEPEFPSCMSTRFRQHVFGTQSSGQSQLDRRLQSIVRREGTFRELMVATLEEYARTRGTVRSRGVQPASGEQLEADGNSFDLVETECASCHVRDGSPVARLLQLGSGGCNPGNVDCSTAAASVLSSVIHDRMPPNRNLSHAEKGHLLEDLAPRAWPDDQRRESALRYISLLDSSSRVHRTDAIINRMAAGGPDEVTLPPHPASLLDDRFSVTLGAVLGLSAVEVCRGAENAQACLEQAITPDVIGQ